MSLTIRTISNRKVPVSFVQAPNGYLYFADGLNRINKWNDLALTSVNAGIDPPVPFAFPAITGVGAGGISGTYNAYVRFIDVDGNVSNLSQISNTIVVSGVGSIQYVFVPNPSDARVARRQILRNTNGQQTTYYVDSETGPPFNNGPYFSSRNEADLATQEAVVLIDSEGRDISDRFGVPRADRPFLAHYLGRIFSCGDIPYTDGHVEAINGSQFISGVGTSWTADMVGRFFYLGGSQYEVTGVDVAGQVLGLRTPFTGVSTKFGEYTIRAGIAERNLLFWSESGGQYDGWASDSAIEVGDLQDEITGLMETQSFLYILQRRSMYRLSYQRNPAEDGAVYLAARRGAVNNRVWVHVGSVTYIMDERGIYTFDGANAEDISGPIQDLFFNSGEYVGRLRINWLSASYFHAAVDSTAQVIRWFVCLGGDRLPRHSLCFNYRTQAWWIEEYPFLVGASVSVPGNSPFVAVGGMGPKLHGLSQSSLDGPETGVSIRGMVTFATLTSIQDSNSSFPSTGMVGSPIAIVAGKGKGQVRTIASVLGTQIDIVMPWTTIPDSTSLYQVGSIPWRWTSNRMTWADVEQGNPRKIGVMFAPQANPASLDVQVYDELDQVPINFDVDWPRMAEESDGVTCRAGLPDATVDLTTKRGYCEVRVDGTQDRKTPEANAFRVGLRGFSGRSHLRVHQISVKGATLGNAQS